MAAKIISSLLTLLACLAIGVFGIFVLMLAMNGVHEKDAQYGFIFYIAAGSLISLISAIVAWFVTGKLKERKWNSVLAVITPMSLFILIAAVLKLVMVFIAIGIADFVRVNY